MNSSVELEDNLFDFDNCNNLEGLTNINETLDEDTLLLYCTKLLECNFEDEKINSYFTVLNKEECQLYFKLGVKCIFNFIQANFTGPPLTAATSDFYKNTLFTNASFKNYLTIDSEEINVNAKHLPLLCAALSIFKHCNFIPTVNLWWHWRTLIIYQQILDELSPNLLEIANQLHKQLQHLKLDSHFQVLLELEQAQLYQIYRHIPKSEQHLKTAQELLGIKHEMVGALGKRTRYQENDVAQLQLTVNVSDRVVHHNECVIPKNLALEDDVRLDTIKFNTDINLPTLTDLEQKYLFLRVKQMLISQPHDNLYYEEIKPFLDYLLNQNNAWSVRVVVLLIRCKLESTHKRTIERCLLQCQEVVDCVKKDESQWFNRVGSVFSTHFPPSWKIEEQLAELMLNTGLIKASLDIYLNLQLWEEVIVCYTLLKLKHKATEIIKQQLEINPTVKLWCLLGDATNDVNCYETAWELSQYRSSRPKRHWAEYFYYRKEYLQSIPHYEESLKINPLQVDIWLHYAFAALEIENWQTAATAYKRYTMLEPGNFQAWNNLAKTYIKLGNKNAAHHALHEAIKCNFDNWKVWDNLMAVSVDIKAFSDVINAYHRILDVKGKHLDMEVLQALTFYVTSSTEETNLLLKRTQELFGRLTSLYPIEGFLWELYADLALDNTTAAQRLQRAHRSYTQIGWEKDLNNCHQVLRICVKLGNCVLSNDIQSTDLLVNSVRLNLTSSLSAIQRQQYELNELNDVNLLLQQVIDKCRSTVTSS